MATGCSRYCSATDAGGTTADASRNAAIGPSTEAGNRDDAERGIGSAQYLDDPAKFCGFPAVEHDTRVNSNPCCVAGNRGHAASATLHPDFRVQWYANREQCFVSLTSGNDPYCAR
jgi:hypothetical protein